MKLEAMTIMIETGEVRRKSPRLVKCSKPGRNPYVRRSAIALVISALALASCNGDDDCNIETQSRELGGAGLQDCGIAHGSNASIVDRCAVDAYAMNATFRALYELDDGRLQAIVHAAGDSYFLLREGEGGGVERADCADGVVANQDGRRFIDCQDAGEFEPICQ